LNSVNLHDRVNTLYTTFIQVFGTGLPVKKKKSNEWLTNGITILYKCEMELYISSRDSSEPQLKINYKKILQDPCQRS
jgi:hypothetical protein